MLCKKFFYKFTYSVLLLLLAFSSVFPNDIIPVRIAFAAEDSLDYEEEKSDKEDDIAEREADGEDTEEQENEYNDIQDEIDNTNNR